MYSIVFQISKFSDWIRCTIDNAENHNLSQKEVKSICEDFDEPYPATPSMPVCSHVGLFLEEDERESCDTPPFEEKCFGKPKKPESC